MNLKELIQQRHSQELTRTAVGFIGNNKKRMAELISLLIINEPDLSRRAAWLASEIARISPSLVAPYVKLLADKLENDFTDPAIIRNMLRLFQQVQIPKSAHAGLMNKCFEFVSAPETAPAIKANALTILYQLCESYPEIRQELLTIIQSQFDHESPAFRSRAIKVLKHLK